MTLWVQETYINATEGHGYGESGVYETGCDTAGELYRQCLSEYGRCVSKCYLDGPDGGAKQIGWVFQGRAEYEDYRRGHGKGDRHYLREVWVTVYDQPPTVQTTYHYHSFKKGAA